MPHTYFEMSLPYGMVFVFFSIVSSQGSILIPKFIIDI